MMWCACTDELRVAVVKQLVLVLVPAIKAKLGGLFFKPFRGRHREGRFIRARAVEDIYPVLSEALEGSLRNASSS